MLFSASRFICTYLLKFFNPGKLLRTLAIAGFYTWCHLSGYSWTLLSGSCIMHVAHVPNHYGIALKGMGEDALVLPA